MINKTANENDIDDVGVTIQTNRKVSEQCGISVTKGNQLPGIMRRNITYRDKHYIRQSLDYT